MITGAFLHKNCGLFFFTFFLENFGKIRKYIISRLRNLTQLDSDSVTAEERATAIKIYGTLSTTIAKEEDENAKRQQEEKEEKLRLEQEEAKKRQVGAIFTLPFLN